MSEPKQSRGVKLIQALRVVLRDVAVEDAFTYGLLAASASPTFWRDVLAEWEAESAEDAPRVAERQQYVDQLVAGFKKAWDSLDTPR